MKTVTLTYKYKEVFEPGYGVIKGFKVSIKLKEGVTPLFCKARPLPYALREQVEQELVNVEKAGVVYRARHSSWPTILVILPKKDKGLRLCGDYRVTVNPRYQFVVTGAETYMRNVFIPSAASQQPKT